MYMLTHHGITFQISYNCISQLYVNKARKRKKKMQKTKSCTQCLGQKVKPDALPNILVSGHQA